jgi:hydrogenase nickel incorporation protein HypA/HybF
MHELGLAQEIVAIACEGAGEAKVLRVVLEVGKLALALPDALRFCFDVCAEGTRAAGARLEIVEVPGRARCRQCGAELLLNEPLGRCDCGATDLEWLSGEELKVIELEVI